MSHSAFARTLLSMWWVYLSVGVLIPLVPHWIVGELNGSGTDVGVTVFVYGVASIASRPLAGAYLRRGRPERLMTAAVAVGAVALVATPLVPQLAWMWGLRFIDGAAVGLFYTCAATGVVRSTTAARRGSTLAVFSVPLFSGVAFGPVVGDWAMEHLSAGWVWVLSGGLMSLAIGSTVFGVALFGDPPADQSEQISPMLLLRALAHPAAVRPAAVLALSIAGWAAFQAFVPLYGPTIGLAATGTVFLTYSAAVIVIRIGGARWFDRMPIIEVITIGCLANICGLLLAALWRRPAALFLAAGLMAIAIALMYTTLMQVALDGAPRRDEGLVVAAYSVSYDVGAGLGGAALGVVMTWTGSYTVVFIGGAAAGVLALALLLQSFWPRRARYAPVRPLPAD
ncbi:MFS transporter [Nakamurella lactea]|uniref:MFS transporter n=1 Tax=Nakamurella lactea TaxID=459515 RepID=UPI000407E047|nr:MFS transporter [Nakamurella lactea]